MTRLSTILNWIICSGPGRRTLATELVLAAIAMGGLVVAHQDPQAEPPLKPVRRAERPRYNPQEWQGTFFKNLFEEGLVGQPAPRQAAPAVASGDRPADGARPAPTTASPDAAALPAAAAQGGGAWSEVIDAEILENEIKRLQMQLDTLITAPVKFQTDYQNARYAFVELATTFAVISKFEAKVRWQDSAAAAQALFTQTAANCRTTSPQAFQSAKNAQEQLRNLVRGGSMEAASDTNADLDWSQFADRIPLMQRLGKALERLQQNSGNKSNFAAARDDLLHDASIIAMLGMVLVQPAVEDADDEDYVALARKMIAAAREVREAIGLDNYEIAAAAINRIEQSCNDCHADWR